jgi:hypothetical protein
MPTLWDYLSFAFFVPTMSVGPINPYAKFISYLDPPDRTAMPVGRAWLRIVVGLWKYLFVANMLGQLTYGGLMLDGHPHGVLDLVISYLKQETVSPLKALGRFVAYGTIGSVFLGIGLVLLLVGLLRVLQEETAVFHGNLSWIPYLIVALAAAVVVALAAWRIVSGPARRRLPLKEDARG